MRISQVDLDLHGFEFNQYVAVSWYRLVFPYSRIYIM